MIITSTIPRKNWRRELPAGKWKAEVGSFSASVVTITNRSVISTVGRKVVLSSLDWKDDACRVGTLCNCCGLVEKDRKMANGASASEG